MYRIWKARGKPDFEDVVKDDIISRQSIMEKNAWEGEGVYLMIEGSEEALKRAGDLLREKGVGALGEKEAEKIYKKIKSEEEDAAAGMGAIFG